MDHPANGSGIDRRGLRAFLPRLRERRDPAWRPEARAGLLRTRHRLLRADRRARLSALKAFAHGRLGDYAKAKACVADSITAALPQPLQAVALNDWSWYAFCERDEADLRLADRRSAEALGARPKSSAVLGTRGCVLLWRGRVTQAIPILERSLEKASTARSRSTEAALLAMAYASRGESVRAQEMFDRAQRLDPDQRLLGEARRYVQAAASSLRLLRAARGTRALLVEPDGIELLGESPPLVSTMPSA